MSVIGDVDMVMPDKHCGNCAFLRRFDWGAILRVLQDTNVDDAAIQMHEEVFGEFSGQAKCGTSGARVNLLDWCHEYDPSKNEQSLWPLPGEFEGPGV